MDPTESTTPQTPGLVPVSPQDLAERSHDLMQAGLHEVSVLLGKPIRLLVVDELPEARDAIRRSLASEPDIAVAGEATTGLEGLWRYKQLQPDVVCTAIDMPEMGGLTMTARLCQRNPEAKVLLLSVRSDPWNMEAAFRAGALDFLTKPAPADTLASAVRVAHRTQLPRRSRVVPAPQDHGEQLFWFQGALRGETELTRVVLGEEIPLGAAVIAVRFRPKSREVDHPPQRVNFGDLGYKLSLPAIGFDFSLADVTDAELAGLAPLMWVEWLNLLGTRVGGQGAGFLGSATRVRFLSLRGAPLDGRALPALRQLTALEELDLASTGLGDDGLGRCLPLPNLRRLHLDDNRLHGDEIPGLLPHLPCLRGLSLDGNPVGPKTLRKLARAILKDGRGDLWVKVTGPPLDRKTRNLVEKTNARGSVGILYRPGKSEPEGD